MAMIGRNPREKTMLVFEELETPSLVVELDRMTENLDRAADYARQHGIALRPHIKTHKSPLLAAEQLARGAVGLTCATAQEAGGMGGGGAEGRMSGTLAGGAPSVRGTVTVECIGWLDLVMCV